jgi:hypothetical protein
MVGDLIILQEGMEIPADGYCIEAADLTTDVKFPHFISKGISYDRRNRPN